MYFPGQRLKITDLGGLSIDYVGTGRFCGLQVPNGAVLSGSVDDLKSTRTCDLGFYEQVAE